MDEQELMFNDCIAIAAASSRMNGISTAWSFVVSQADLSSSRCWAARPILISRDVIAAYAHRS